MSLDESILKWIEVARWAPSADNSQPWVMDWEIISSNEVRLDLSVRSHADIPGSIYESMDLVALGAFAYNILCAAKADGFQPLSIEPAGRGFCLHLHQEGSSADGEDSIELIHRRRTCRKLYEKIPLHPEDRASVERIAGKFPNLHCLGFRSSRSQAALLISKLDLIRYQNDTHLNRLLKVLRFGKEAQVLGDGLDVKYLEIPWVAAAFFRLLRRFPGLRWIFFTSLVRIFTRLGCRILIENASELFLLSAEDNTPQSWFDLGQCLQEIWIEATRRNLALQPLGHSFIPLDVQLTPSSYSHKHQAMVQSVQKELLAIGADFSKPGLLFRIGYTQDLEGPKSNRYELDRLTFRLSK